MKCDSCNKEAIQGKIFCLNCDEEIVAICVCGLFWDYGLLIDELSLIGRSLPEEHVLEEQWRCTCGHTIALRVDGTYATVTQTDIGAKNRYKKIKF